MSGAREPVRIEGRDVTIVQPHPGNVPNLFNVRDQRRVVAILLRIGDNRWRVVRTEVGGLADPVELDAADVQEAARLTLCL